MTGLRTLLFAILLAGPSYAAPILFVEAGLDTNIPRVQAQTKLELRFFQGSDVRDVRFFIPPQQLADIRPLGSITVSEEQQGGLRYRVHRQSFAVIPFASGPVSLSGIQARGQLAGSRRVTEWPVPPLSLQVKPADPRIDPWLAARTLVLTDRWIPEDRVKRVGELLTRTIRIEGRGLDARQLPEVTFTTTNATVIARPAHAENHIVDGELMAVREQSYDMLAQQPGQLSIPDVIVKWWNSALDKPASTELPGRSFSIAGTGSGAPEKSPAARQTDYSGLAPGLALFALVIFLGRQRHAWRLWWNCCRGDVSALQSSLLTWGQRRWPENPPRSLIDLSLRCPDPLKSRLQDLDRHLYGSGSPCPPRNRQSCLPFLKLRSCQHR